MVKYVRNKKFGGIQNEKRFKSNEVSEGNDFGQTCAGVLRSYGCDVKMVPKNGAEILHKTETEKPDVVVMDAFMTAIDALGVLKEMPKMKSKRSL